MFKKKPAALMLLLFDRKGIQPVKICSN